MKLILALILIALISSTTDTIKDKVFDKEKSNEPNLEIIPAIPAALVPVAGIAMEAIAHASNVMTYNDIANTLYKAHKRHLKRLQDKKKGKNLRKKNK